uniref:Serine/threonine-protein phosphatase 4 regulatory subunit 1 n=1 Tax=Phytophthora ramorum TaxID=164328 RepID=H3GYE2_PHYRM
MGNESELANGPTFEDLAIDDSLSDLQRVTKYVCSNIALQRVIHVKMLHDTARSVGYQATCDQLLPLLEPLVCDVEYVVRQHVALQFPLLCQFLVETKPETGYRVLLDKLIPLVTKLVSDDQHEVRSAASESLVEMAALVKPEDQGQHVLTIVLPLAHDDDNEQFRISAVTLYNGLAEHFGPELCQQFCVPELISLSEDPVFRVRKSTALSFPNVCKTAGVELSRERLIPAFQRLAKDDIWGVRKACAECLVNVALALAPADRGPRLIPLFESFIGDSSRWVRMAAYQSLGPFLAALEKDQVTDELVAHFTSMATTAASQLGGSGEVDIKFHCAFNFPAVVSILGAADWLKLSPTFELLHSDTFWKIRRSFAYSLHELARILGQGITETQLATAFDSYLHDVQDVRLGVMLHFADFLENVSPSFRESYLPVLAEFDSFDNTTKWRFREVLSGQLAQLCRTFTPEATFSVINPLVFKLVTDPVAVVREQSYHSEDDEVQEDTKLADAARDFFSSKLAAVFFTLALDPVSNVRVVFAETAIKHQELCREHPECPDVLRELMTTESSTADELASVLSERVKERFETQATLDAEAKSKEAEKSPTTSVDAEKESESNPDAKSEYQDTASETSQAVSVDVEATSEAPVSDEGTTAEAAPPPAPVEAGNTTEPAPLLQAGGSETAPSGESAETALDQVLPTDESSSSSSAASSEEARSPEANGSSSANADAADEVAKSSEDPAA